MSKIVKMLPEKVQKFINSKLGIRVLVAVLIAAMLAAGVSTEKIVQFINDYVVGLMS